MTESNQTMDPAMIAGEGADAEPGFAAAPGTGAQGSVAAGDDLEVPARTLDLMRELTQLIGVSGQERYVCRALERHYRALADEVIHDNNGSVYAVKRSHAPNPFRVMVAAHADEVGLVVRQIRANGLITATKVGGLFYETLAGARVRLLTDAGDEFRGCVSMLSAKRIKRDGAGIPFDALYFDFGFRSEAEARACGVLEGCQIVIDGPFEECAGGRLLSKAWDDRFGCILGVELLQALQGVELPFDLYVGANVQEEVGLRGARTAAEMIQPDLAVVLDCTAANDVERFEMPYGGIGQGVMVRYTDGTYLPNRTVFLDYLDLLKREGIPYQFHESAGGTDAGAINLTGCGVPALTACICARNVHSGSLMIDARDYLHCLKAVTRWVSELDADKLERFRSNNR